MIVNEKILGRDIFIDNKNSNFSFNKYNLENNLIKEEYENLDLRFSNYNTYSITLCINISNGCNLKCDYCFNTKKKWIVS